MIRRVLLRGLRVPASIGVLPHERKARQALIIDTTCEVCAAMPLDDHDIGTVLDYRLLRTALIEVVGKGHTDLLETLVERALDRLLQDFPEIRRATVRICKPEAFEDCDQVCIEQSRTRGDDPA